MESKNVVVSEDIDVFDVLTTLVPTDRDIYPLKQSWDKVEQQKLLSKTLENLHEHALMVCNTTSALFNKGKIKFTINFEKRNDLYDSVAEFKNMNEDLHPIFQQYCAPAKITVWIEVHFSHRNNCQKCFLSSLPPTSDSAF